MERTRVPGRRPVQRVPDRQRQLSRSTRWRLTAAAALVTGVLLSPVATSVAGAFELSTDYPGVAVGPGEATSFALEVTSDRRERVDLSVVEAPQGWGTTLRGGGFEVSSVFTDPESPPAIELEVRVPADATPGGYRVVVQGAGSGQTRTLDVNLNVAENVAGAFELTSEFASLRGKASDTYSYTLTLRNSSARAATFGLAATGPEGWIVDARPSGSTQATTVTVDAGSTATLTVTADPPESVTADSYPLVVEATGAGRTLTAELTAEVVGTFTMTFATADERLNARGSAGGTTSMALVVTNDGSAPLDAVTFSATPPSGWEVSFEPETIERIPPGEQATVTARIKPSGDAVAGDYDVSLTASSAGTTESIAIRYAVETSGLFGFLGITVIVLAIAGLLWVFRRYGRR